MRISLMPFSMEDPVRWNVGIDLPCGMTKPELFFKKVRRQEFPDIIAFYATTPEQEWLCVEVMMKIFDKDVASGFCWLPTSTVFDLEHIDDVRVLYRIRVLIENLFNLKRSFLKLDLGPLM